MGQAIVAERLAGDAERLHSVIESLRQSQNLAVAGQFAAAIMHEINNPLEAVMNLNFLVRHNFDDPAQVAQYSQLIEEQLDTIVGIARQTLSFYKPAMAREKISVASLAEAALRVHQKSISEKEIRLYKSLGSDVTVEAHPGEMLQVLSNLIANAVDALPVRGALHLRIRRSCRGTRIVVADNGPGIPHPSPRRYSIRFLPPKRNREQDSGWPFQRPSLKSITAVSESEAPPGRDETELLFVSRCRCPPKLPRTKCTLCLVWDI